MYKGKTPVYVSFKSFDDKGNIVNKTKQAFVFDLPDRIINFPILGIAEPRKAYVTLNEFEYSADAKKDGKVYAKKGDKSAGIFKLNFVPTKSEQDIAFARSIGAEFRVG